MKIDKIDVAIIGAGFAGLSAGIHAAQAGVKAVVFESEDKLNGDCCAGGLPDFGLARMGFSADSDFVVNKVNRIELVLSNSVVALDLKHISGLIIDKTMLTVRLASLCEKADVPVLLGSKVTGYNHESGLITVEDELGENNFQADVIIDASGCDTKMARDAGLVKRLDKKDVCLCAQYLIKQPSIDKNIMKMWCSQELAPAGYIWSFPTGKGQSRVGMGVCDHKTNPKKIIEDFIADEFPDAELLKYVGATIPLAPPMENIVFDKVMLVGDRANQVFALTGAGNMLAYDCGAIAGKVAGRYLNDKLPNLLQYEKECKKRFYRKLLNSYNIKEKIRLGGNDAVEDLYRKVRPLFLLHRLFPRWVERSAWKHARYS